MKIAMMKHIKEKERVQGMWLVTGVFFKRGKNRDKPIRELCDSIQTFEVEFRLWQNQLISLNILYFTQLKSVEIALPKLVKDYSRSIFQPQEELDERFHYFDIKEL
jgi:hypothetical protein